MQKRLYIIIVSVALLIAVITLLTYSLKSKINIKNVLSNIFLSTKELEIKYLEEFLHNVAIKPIHKKDISTLLYDIQSHVETSGRAIKITQNLFLTNYHVISKKIEYKTDLRLIISYNRQYLKDDKGKFEILHYNKEKDLALLKILEKTEDAPSVQLFQAQLSTGSKVIEFIQLDNAKKEIIEHTGYRLDIGGRDLYDPEKHIPHIASLILPPNSSLFEKQGEVLPFLQDRILELTKDFPSKKEIEILTSIPVYQGESGSPIFYENTNKELYFAGITTKALETGEEVRTPGHPLGYAGYIRTVSFAVHAEAIKSFILSYLNKLKTLSKSSKEK